MHESVKLAPHGYPGSNPGLSTFDKLSALALEIGESSQDEKFTLDLLKTYLFYTQKYEAPRAYARGILKFFGERNPPKHYPSTLLRQAQDSLRVSAISHSSTSLHSWFSAKADKNCNVFNIAYQ